MFDKYKKRIEELERENERLRQNIKDLELTLKLDEGLKYVLNDYFDKICFINGEGWTLELKDKFYKYKEIDDKKVFDYIKNRIKGEDKDE